MSERAPLTDAELERLSEKLLSKLLARAAGQVRALVQEPSNQNKRDLEPTLEDFARLRAVRRRKGQRSHG